MNNHLNRIYHFKGNPHEIGFTAGRMLGAKLEQTLSHYIDSREHASDMNKLCQGALPWLRRLPKRFQDEFEGMAEGAKLPLQSLAEWAYIEECESNRCSGAVGLFGNRAWVARNNDTYVPELWGYVTIREVDGRIPTINFSMEGTFSLRRVLIEKNCGCTITSYLFGTNPRQVNRMSPPMYF